MACVRFTVSSPALIAAHMDLQSSRLRGAASPGNIRFKRCCFKAIRAVQVSGAESQAVPAADRGGRVKKKSGTLYEVLGVSRGATAQDIKSAYRKLARQFHPDAAAASPQAKSTSTQMFLQIHSAYAILSRPEDRAQYDRQLVMQENQRRNGSWRSSKGAYRYSPGHVVRNWETDQCW